MVTLCPELGTTSLIVIAERSEALVDLDKWVSRKKETMHFTLF